MAALIAITTNLAADPTPSKSEVLKRAAAYVAAQADLLPQLVAEERSTQMLRPRVVRSTPPRVIETRADFAWIRLEGVSEAIGVRDIRAIDGKPVGGAERLEELLRRPTPSSIEAARALLAESARFNLGPLWRNVNLPTTALLLLHGKLQPRFSWKAEGTDGSSTVVLSFKERERPTVIRGRNNEPVFSRGRVWIDPATGAVQRTELHTEARDPEGRKTFYLLVVEFAMEPSLQLRLPRRLREHYETRVEVVDGEAEYVNYRRFQTEGRLVH
jgi:hypothetical protein